MSGRTSRGILRGLNAGSGWSSFMLPPGTPVCVESFASVRARFIVLYIALVSFVGLAIIRKPTAMMCFADRIHSGSPRNVRPGFCGAHMQIAPGPRTLQCGCNVQNSARGPRRARPIREP